MSINVIAIRSKAELKKFIKLSYKIYKGNRYWVAPMMKEMLQALDPTSTEAVPKIRKELFLALLDGRTAGRIYAGIDSNLNAKKNIKLGFFSLFECIDNQAVAVALMNAAIAWFKENGIETFIGPVSQTGTDGDEYKGLLINCFDRPPSIMNSYNPPYYKKLLEGCGLEKDYDVFAYYMDKEIFFTKDPTKAIEFAQKRYNFRIETLDRSQLEREIKDIHHVMQLAIPDEWPDLVAPTLEEVREMADKLLQFADPELIAIARSGDDAIGFDIVLPDFNQVLLHMKGRMNPLSVIKYMWYKRRINAARVFVMFVVPAFRSKGVSFAIYHKSFQNSLRKGYTWGEASTIGETNKKMRSDIENIGALHYKTYRIFKGDL